MLENNPHLTSQEIAEEFGIHHTTVVDHIKSPSDAPSDYYLFRPLQSYLTEKKSFESISKAIADYFNSKNENFCIIGIYMLPERWQQVVTNNGACIID
ncbi:histone-lysine N-methyltransferase SETMAR [Trichonephila clavipes]|nr:histone-lysine N-methyltransferase SETMAR [Trichonephila clavipes]